MVMASTNFHQRTIARTVRFDGVGLHSGETVRVEIRPADANTGILFQRTDLPGKPYISARADSVFDTSLATRIGTPEASVSTIEHLMGAFFAMGIDNAVVALDSFELPILDGSAVPFLVLLDEAGIAPLAKLKKFFTVRSVVEIVDPRYPDRFIRVEPSKSPLLTYAIDFSRAAAIGKQAVTVGLSGSDYCRELCYARTFCLEEDIQVMYARGLAKGGSQDNAIVVNAHSGVVNARGLRSPTEFVRHKALDCVGDLALLGMPLVGHVIAHKAGHDLHTQLAKRLWAERDNHSVSEPNRRQQNTLSAAFGFIDELSGLSDFIALGAIRG
jgi:UDP-3-O-[3-hydroxymyristoyl] N-acetylglucosamine deacetylase